MSATTYTAVLDRIVDGETAVLLLEDESDGDIVDELAVPVDRLPADGAHEGAVFDVECELETNPDRGDGGRDAAGEDENETESDGASEAADEADGDVEVESLLEATYRPEAERERRERAQDRFDRLSERLSDE